MKSSEKKQHIRKNINSDGSATYTFFDDMGDAEMTVYNIFPGVKLTYHSVHNKSCCLGSSKKGNLVEIHHCREGRMERYNNGEFFYLMPGDLSVNLTERKSCEYNFPLRYYHGITVTVNLDTAPSCFSCFLKDVDVHPEHVAKKLCADRSCFVIRSQKYVEHIFSELYTVPDSYKKAYFKIKILELFLVLSEIDPSENGLACLSLPKQQVELAKRVASYLSQKANRRITLTSLSIEFNVSQTYLQNAFKGVYGVTVCSYIRIQKIQAAALRLVHTELSVMQIANECGYDNASKFAAAFREIMGETPLEYRKTHRNIRI